MPFFKLKATRHVTGHSENDDVHEHADAEDDVDDESSTVNGSWILILLYQVQ
jgi:hypothetical protein